MFGEPSSALLAAQAQARQLLNSHIDDEGTPPPSIFREPVSPLVLLRCAAPPFARPGPWWAQKLGEMPTVPRAKTRRICIGVRRLLPEWLLFFGHICPRVLSMPRPPRAEFPSGWRNTSVFLHALILRTGCYMQCEFGIGGPIGLATIPFSNVRPQKP